MALLDLINFTLIGVYYKYLALKYLAKDLAG